MSGDDFGDRMKEIEFQETSRRFLKTLPIVARVDGRGFSQFTKNMNRPFDTRMRTAMVEMTKHIVDETKALIGYCQSDEATFIWHAPEYKSSVFFDGKIMKMTSVLAGLATASFTRAILNSDDADFREYAKLMPHFDARVMSVPSQTEAANMLLWRSIDCFKNSVSMVAHHHFSHSSLQGMNQAKMQERLFQEKGINFGEDMPEWFKRGTFVTRQVVQRAFTEEELEKIPENRRPDKDTLIYRNVVTPIEMPIFSKVTNRVGVIFNNEAPVVLEEPVDPVADRIVESLQGYCQRAN